MAEKKPDEDLGATGHDPAPRSDRGARRNRSFTSEQRRFLNRLRSTPEEHLPMAPGENPAKRTRRALSDLSGTREGEISRIIELQSAILIIAVVVGLGLAFLFGTKINYFKYLLSSRNEPTLSESKADQFPGIGADDLVLQALVAERDGHWQDAVERFMAAKKKNLQYRGFSFALEKSSTIIAIFPRWMKLSSAPWPSARTWRRRVSFAV